MNGISDEQFRKILDNNILSSHWLIQMVLPEMAARRDGAIIVVSSIGGLRGSPTIGAYNVSKAADFQLVRNYAVENRRAQYPHQRDRAGAHPHRFRARAVGEPEGRGERQPDDADAADRRGARARGRRGVPGIGGGPPTSPGRAIVVDGGATI